MKRFGSIIVCIAMIITLVASFASCTALDIDIYGCGSGLYLGGSDDYKYYIRALDATSDGACFVLEDYFYSEELGEKYEVHDEFFKVGETYLAKKSDYYDPQVYDINIDTYGSSCLTISSNMDYVHIYSESGEQKAIYIEVEPRDIPLDITFENVNICTPTDVPVVFSKTYQDINIKAVGRNTLQAGCVEDRHLTTLDKLKNGLYEMEHRFACSLSETLDLLADIPDSVMSGDITDIIRRQVSASRKAIFTAADDYYNFIVGKPGEDGVKGVTGFVHLGGVCLYGDGILTIVGGRGTKGGDASSSLGGASNGGNGGRGGTGISCARLITTDEERLSACGGSGGKGGAPSEGLFGLLGSSGEYGREGIGGVDYDVADPMKPEED